MISGCQNICNAQCNHIARLTMHTDNICQTLFKFLAVHLLPRSGPAPNCATFRGESGSSSIDYTVTRELPLNSEMKAIKLNIIVALCLYCIRQHLAFSSLWEIRVTCRDTDTHTYTSHTHTHHTHKPNNYCIIILICLQCLCTEAHNTDKEKKN